MRERWAHLLSKLEFGDRLTKLIHKLRNAWTRKPFFYCSDQENIVEFNHYFVNVASKHHRYIILQTNNLNTTDILFMQCPQDSCKEEIIAMRNRSLLWHYSWASKCVIRSFQATIQTVLSKKGGIIYHDRLLSHAQLVLRMFYLQKSRALYKERFLQKFIYICHGL